jgi:O-glycosyl hydrolase
MRLFRTSIIAVFLLIAPASVRADYTAVVSPGSILATNFQGWGASLAWWANVIGSYPNRTNFVDMAFSQLKLNIARYNIGGGENPSSPVPGQGYRTVMQGFEPTNGIWNWNVDTSQRWVLQQAEARGVNLVDAFANSPPWWMCVNSNCVGNASFTNNLQVNCEMDFATYLATVVSNLTVLDGDHFDYVTPMNEPVGTKWYSGSPGQEGCDMSHDQQVRVVNDLYAQLQTSAPSVGIDAAEDVDPTQTYNDLTSYPSYSSTALGHVSLFTTHTYSFSGAANLKSEASSQHKTLWVSEYGDNDASGMKMARRIHDDITIMGLRAWVYWQVVDSASGWGLLFNSLLATTNPSYTPNYTINEKFYVMGQFSEFIRPGFTIISVNDTNTLAAYNPTNSTLVLVMINTNGSSLNVTYNLNSFGSLPWQVSATRTSLSENMTNVPAPIVMANQFTYAIPAQSITTFVLTTNTSPPVFVSQLPQPHANSMMAYAGQTPTFSISATGTLPIHYQWMSNSVSINGATNTSYTSPAGIQGSTNSYTCVATNLFGSATSMVWSVSIIPAPVASYPTTVLTLNPIGYWRLNEAEQGGGDNGLIAEDDVGGNNGIYTNVLLGQPGFSMVTEPSATSARFGYIATHDSCVSSIGGPDFSLPNGSNAEFTVMAWVNSTGTNGLNTPTVAAKGLYFQEEYALDAGAPNSSFRFSVRNAAGTAYNANSTVSLTNTAQWYHLAGVCDEANGRVALYINGLLATSATMPAASGITNSSETPMTIGSRSSTSTSGFDQQFPGYINDVAIFNYALNLAQVHRAYISGLSLQPVGLTLTNANGNEILNWNYGTLQSATNVDGPYLDLTNVTQPYIIPPTNTQQFFRVKEN